jgi:hypothetical protein
VTHPQHRHSFLIGTIRFTAGKADGLAGKTIRATYTGKVCNKFGCDVIGPTTAHVYVGTNGHIFDFEAGAGPNGNLVLAGVPKKLPGSNATILVTTSGNTLRWKTISLGGATTQIFAVRGDSCEVSVQTTFKLTQAYVTSQSCTVSSGNSQ